MTNRRYAIRPVLKDGTLDDAMLTANTKREAIRLAKAFAKITTDSDVVSFWVDDTKTDLGVFKIDRAA